MSDDSYSHALVEALCVEGGADVLEKGQQRYRGGAIESIHRRPNALSALHVLADSSGIVLRDDNRSIVETIESTVDNMTELLK